MTFLSRGVFIAAVFSALPSLALAAGMVPETPLVFIQASDGGGTINVKNTDSGPALLYTTVRDLPEDKAGVHVVPTQPIIRVEAGKTQQVRFILEAGDNLKVQQLKRVVFEGIPEHKPGSSLVTFTVSQDLPLIVHPAGLPDVNDPWTRLTWTEKNGSLVVSNSTPYVVRLDQRVILLPSSVPGSLSKSYLLPGDTMTVSLKPGTALPHDKQVKLFPATRYGFQAPDFTAPITR